MNTTYERPSATPRAARAAARPERLLAAVSLGGTALFAVLLVLLHLLRPDADPVGRRIMDYAHGPYGLLMNVAYLALGIGTLALAIGLARAVSPAGRSPFGLVLLAMFGASALIAAVLNADPPGAPGTIGSLIHTKAAVLGFGAIGFAALLLPDRWRRDPAWASLARPARAAGAVALAGAMLTLFTPPFLNGLTQRIILLGTLAWILLTAGHLRRVAAGTATTGAMSVPPAQASASAAARDRRAAWPDALLGWVGTIATGYVALAYLLLHPLRPDMDPLARFLSEYVHGPYGGLMTSTFFVCAVAVASVALGLWQAVAPEGRSRTGLILLAIAGAGVALAGIFPVDPPGGPETPSALLHELAGNLFFIALVVASLLLPDRWRADRAWAPLARAALIAGGVALGGVALGLLLAPALGGLAQRIVLAGLLTWLLLTSRQLRHGGNAVPARHPGATPSPTR